MTTAIPTSLHELQTKLANLVDDLDDRLTHDDTISRIHLLEALLDRLFELATPNRTLCPRCQRRPATVYVHAGPAGTDQFHAETVCVNCTLHAVTAASSAGPVHVESYPTTQTETGR